MTELGLPPIGLGTCGTDDPVVVANALDLGYRHLDTQPSPGTEAAVGEGLATSRVSRDEVTVATTLPVDRRAPTTVRVAIEDSLARLGVDAVDLCYVPLSTAEDPERPLRAVEALVDDGLVAHLAVSNGIRHHLDVALDVVDHPLAAHRRTHHPYGRASDLVEHARQHDYAYVAASPLAGGRVLEDPVVQQVGMQHDASAAQAALAYVTGPVGVVAIPTATRIPHLRANLASPGLALTDDQRQRLHDLERGDGHGGV